MQFDKFTFKTQEALGLAQNLAVELRHAEITSLHLFSVLLKEEDSLARNLLEQVGGSAGQAASWTEQQLGMLPTISGSQPTLSHELTTTLQQALDEAKAWATSM